MCAQINELPRQKQNAGMNNTIRARRAAALYIM